MNKTGISAWLRAAARHTDGALEAELLAAYALSRSRAWLYAHGDAPLTGAQRQRLEALLARRIAGEPMAYILGEREFWSRPFKVTPAVLIPRPETETLVEKALSLPLPEDAHILDLGTGTGCIAITLAAERPDWAVTATDRSPEALALARENRRALGVDNLELLQSDWFSALSEKRFDLIVSNPPYVAPGDRHLDTGDVRFEPSSARVAGDRGLADIRAIIEGSHPHLNDNGWLALEHGHDQSQAVKTLLQDTGFTDITTEKDGAGIPRIAFARLAH